MTNLTNLNVLSAIWNVFFWLGVYKSIAKNLTDFILLHVWMWEMRSKKKGKRNTHTELFD